MLGNFASLAGAAGVAIAVAACGGAAPPASPIAVAEVAPVGTTRARPPAAAAAVEVAEGQGDVVERLAPGTMVSWLAPARAQLELGGSWIDAPAGERPIRVGVIDRRQGSSVRVAVWLPHARFALWVDREGLLGLVQREQRVAAMRGGSTLGDAHATLFPGAKVERLERAGGFVFVRYSGAIRVEGWVPEAALGDASLEHQRRFRRPIRRTLHVAPGTVVRGEPRFAGRELAVVGAGFFLELLRKVDDQWDEVSFADADVHAQGFVSRQAPLGRVARPAEVPVIRIAPDAKVASGTCLYARRDGEAIGYVVGERDVQLEELAPNWWTLALDTPWGPIGFVARGPAATELAACAPARDLPAP